MAPPVREGSAAASPLVIVSNRLPMSVSRGPRGLEHRRSPGGLISALEPALRRRGGKWVGWPGIELRSDERLHVRDVPYEVHAVRLTEVEVKGYYHGFANRTLWPLFHCFPGRTHFDRADWKQYERVNARFAEATSACATGAELFWVHDYQLMLAPLTLRATFRAARMAFFMHIPFPPYDLFRLLPWDQELLRGLLACDLIGFHVETYVRNFLDCVERLLGARVDREARLVEHGDRTVQVGAFPLGIDFDAYEARTRALPAPRRPRRQRMILGVDRLDYTKGIPERILAFERLLEVHPEHREEVVLLQVAVPSRVQVAEYRDQKREIDELVGRINGRFATAEWSPIRYLYRSVSPDELVGLYRDADVAMVTPLRDGMNLVAKEFVACQIARPGVLVLSRLAGAAETMREAVLVNPYNLDGAADALHRALTMDEAERRGRLAALRQREQRDNVNVWLQRVLSAALAPSGLRPPSDRDFEAWLGTFLDDHRLAIFLDFDGTLAPLCEHPREVAMSAAMQRVLDACIQRPDTDVAVVSGRGLADVAAMVGRPALTYAANHGLEIAGPGVRFRHDEIVHFESKLVELATSLGAAAPPGAWVERKGATLTFHYRGVPAHEQAHAAARARALILEAGFLARDAHAAVEGRPPIAWDKGHAVFYILRHRYGPSWSEAVRVVYVGDDQTDEDAFRMLAGLAVTFRVGSAETHTTASHRLPNVDAVQALLSWLAQRPVSAGGSRIHAADSPTSC